MIMKRIQSRAFQTVTGTTTFSLVFEQTTLINSKAIANYHPVRLPSKNDDGSDHGEKTNIPKGASEKK